MPLGASGERMDYRLYFGELEVGQVERYSAEASNCSGKLLYCDALVRPSSPEVKLLREFIRLSEDSARLTMLNGLADADLAKVNGRLSLFGAYFAPNVWALVDGAGKRHSILTPLFCGRNDISWRWGESDRNEQA